MTEPLVPTPEGLLDGGQIGGDQGQLFLGDHPLRIGGEELERHRLELFVGGVHVDPRQVLHHHRLGALVGHQRFDRGVEREGGRRSGRRGGFSRRLGRKTGGGWYAYDAIQRREYNILMATFILSGVVELVALLVADVAYAVLDPRVSYEAKGS